MILGYFGGCFIALVTIAIFHFIRKWRNPTCINGRLPPGSMGLPLIGETIQFLIPSKSMDVPSFISKRIKKYGPVFRTSLVGRPVVVSSDPDFNHYILQQEGRLVELWYMDSFAKLCGQMDTAADGSPITAFGLIHKYIRNLILNHFGPEVLKEKLLPELEELWVQALRNWKACDFVEVKQSTSAMMFDLTAKALFGYEPDKSGEDTGKNLTNFVDGVMSVPLNVPGTAFHRCMQGQKKLLKLVNDVIQERRAHPEKHRGDFLDQILDDMKHQTFLTDNSVPFITFGLLLGTVETVSSTITLTIKLLIEHPFVVEELMREHEEILNRRENREARITWDEYKSLTFTMQVIQESLRLGNIAPGILRRAIRDIEVNGYTIPKGWTIFAVPAAIHLNPETYEDPLSFNPWRWKGLEFSATQKNFVPFGGGARQCAGAEFSKLLLALCIHEMLTKYR
ncbi:hypothetical protein RHSIM_Rhsim08G0028300 [Rhododendron simsii]|uniref:Cytochrome P450 n=1 Tax=Rhododendron simsii TaxID=118357 RepID=A0A834GIC2_RHOSS|nr:hypothetical protein RHSIM_Rhsim08G0028300 [Rhododendron simsii]